MHRDSTSFLESGPNNLTLFEKGQRSGSMWTKYFLLIPFHSHYTVSHLILYVLSKCLTVMNIDSKPLEGRELGT